MAMTGTDSGSFLGAGIRKPSCWETFGFSGQTNRENLEQAYHERIRLGPMSFMDYGKFQDIVTHDFNACLKELADASR